MHIAFVESGYPHPHGGGGAGTYVQLVGRELVLRGHHVSVVAAHCDQCPTVEDDEGVRVYRPKFKTPIHYYWSKLPLLGQLSTAVKLLERGAHTYRFIEQLHRLLPIDLVEFSEGGDFWHAWRRPFSIIAHLHGSRYTFLRQSDRDTEFGDWWQRRMELAFIRRADYVVSPSRALLDIVTAESGHFLPSSAIIPYPLDSTLFKGDCSEVRGDDSNGPFRVMFAARNDPVKGADALLKAVPNIVQQVPNVEFHFYGFQPEKDQPIPDGVVIHPFVPRDELLQSYHLVDICVVPSIWDNSPYTVYEAMAAGKPIVATGVGGIPELVIDDETGLLIEPDNPEQLVSALLLLISNTNLRLRLGRNGRKRAKELFEAQYQMDRRIRLYQDLCAPPANGADDK